MKRCLAERMLWRDIFLTLHFSRDSYFISGFFPAKKQTFKKLLSVHVERKKLLCVSVCKHFA